MSDLETSAREQGAAVILALTGELDISSAERVEAELERIEAGGPAPLVLDLSGLQFMDSTGLRIVVGAETRARRRGGRFVVVRGPEAVQRIFRITRLDERLEMVDAAGDLGVPAA
jgi:anti-anti-sigma factor